MPVVGRPQLGHAVASGEIRAGNLDPEQAPLRFGKAPEDPAGPFANSPFARCLGIRIQDDGTLMMPFSPKIIGNPILPAIHGGMTGAFLETTAIVGVTRELGAAAPPKPIGLTINYLRSGRALDSFANVSIVRQGQRIVAFQAQAWQDDMTKPIATAFGHFKLRQAGDKD